MANVKTEWGTSTAITATGLASLASSATAGYELAAIDNSSNKYLDIKLTISLKLATGSPASDKTVYIYTPLSEDGTVFEANATGSAGAITLRVPPGMTYLGSIPCPDSGAIVYDKVFASLAAAIGGRPPKKVGLVFINFTGLAFSATTTDFAVTWSGEYETVT